MNINMTGFRWSAKMFASELGGLRPFSLCYKIKSIHAVLKDLHKLFFIFLAKSIAEEMVYEVYAGRVPF